ncbi:MAG: hypothetical protein Q7J16_02120 [Candidatus Cloacimonadales bacterium]|nr:hypothetical protein [Candidatus Cloacimonadales bacterium]
MEQKQLNIFLNVDERYSGKTKYVFNTLCRVLGLKPRFFTGLTSEVIHLYYGKRTEDIYPVHIYHDPGAADFFEKKEIYPIEQVSLMKYQDEYVPVLFSKQGELIRYTSNSIRLRKDIISSAFYFLSCWQEYASSAEISPQSQYDYYKSFQYSFGFTDIPPVDRYCEILANMLKKAFPEFVFSSIWPEGKKYAISLSHNVEFWNVWTENFIAKITQEKNNPFHESYWQVFWKAIIHKYSRKIFKDPAKLIKLIIRREKILKASSSFFLLTKSDFPDERRNYFKNEQYFKQIVQLLKDGSVNLQGSKEAGFQYHFLPEELQKLEGFSANGFRVRYLNFNYQNLFSVLEQGAIKYDSSVGFDEKIGFRAGISYPFQPYNLKEDRPFNILEIPLIAMDLAMQKQVDFNYRKAKRKFAQLLDKSKKHRSHFSVCWHTHLSDPIDYPGWSKLYWQILKRGRSQNAWLCSLDKLYNYWQNR